MESTTVATAAFLAQLKDAMEKKKPIAFYYWTPEWIHAAYKLSKLGEPEFDGYTTDSAKGTERYKDKGCYTFYQPSERNDWLEASSIKCGQPPTRVNIAFSKALNDRAPKIGQFLKQVTLNADDVNAWILAMEVDKKDMKDVAKAWVDANKAMIERNGSRARCEGWRSAMGDRPADGGIRRPAATLPSSRFQSTMIFCEYIARDPSTPLPLFRHHGRQDWAAAATCWSPTSAGP